MGVHERRRIVKVGSGEPSFEFTHGLEPAALHPLAQAVNQRSDVLWAVLQQRRRGHDRIGPN